MGALLGEGTKQLRQSSSQQTPDVQHRRRFATAPHGEGCQIPADPKLGAAERADLEQLATTLKALPGVALIESKSVVRR